jgi:hypothetical protein
MALHLPSNLLAAFALGLAAVAEATNAVAKIIKRVVGLSIVRSVCLSARSHNQQIPEQSVAAGSDISPKVLDLMVGH